MHLFAALYVFMPGESRPSFPVTRIYHASRFHFNCEENATVRCTLLRLADYLESLTPGELLLLCELMRFAGPHLGSLVPSVVRACWNTRIYHLRLDALQMAEWNATTLAGPAREEMKQLLGSLHSNNLGLSTSIVDALLAYDMVQSPVQVEDVRSELAEILASPDKPSSRQRAYYAIANSFEDIYQGAFWEAIEALPPDRRVTLLTMGALGAGEYSSWVGWILRELVQIGDAQALPAFLHWAATIDTQSCFPQEVTACYVWAVAGCALHLDAPPAIVSPQIDAQRVWEAYGAILFWTYKPGLTVKQRKAAAESHWEILHGRWPFEAVDPLVQLGRVAFKCGTDGGNPLDDLCALFPDEVRRALEFGLRNRTRLMSLFGRIPFEPEGPSFLIRWLGVVGNRGTLQLLEPLVDTTDLGPAALEAVRRLKGAERAAL
jgi:hypothetical protein